MLLFVVTILVLCFWQHFVRVVGIVMPFMLVFGIPCCDSLTAIVLIFVLIPPIGCLREHFSHFLIASIHLNNFFSHNSFAIFRGKWRYW